MSRPWLEFISQPGVRKVRCPRCGKQIEPQRMARGAHASWCLRQASSVPSGNDSSDVMGVALNEQIRGIKEA
jgi:hypothetical protein